ncbi:thioredoxin fold domain-containing protein [Pontibacter sp. G13]|uniref:thioredoxin family protein n=1 Tax=Pontibacter sp. G13 TaxID=3074898 RepID=UPI00288A67FE|nr:thioredoxin fold domain-containing protein [Pontibacter sp. G13]WNJ19503.1 thioredoxin family protein [Pontibacter sp. G13]
MKSWSILLIALFSLFTLSSVRASETRVPFYSNLKTIQQEAQASNRIYMVYFEMATNRSCKRMEKKVWQDETLVPFISENYLACKLHALSPQAIEAVQRYQVYDYPTVIFFSPNGKMMGRTIGYVAPNTLQQILEKHSRTWEIRQQNMYEHLVLPWEQKQQAQSIAQQMIIPKPVEEKSIGEGTLADLYVSRGQDESEVHLEVPGLEAYSLKQLKSPEAIQNQFGLLIGSYTQYNQLTERLEELERFWRGEIYVYSEVLNGIPVYKLILGNYQEKNIAETYARSMYKFKQMKATVLNLRNLTS